MEIIENIDRFFDFESPWKPKGKVFADTTFHTEHSSYCGCNWVSKEIVDKLKPIISLEKRTRNFSTFDEYIIHLDFGFRPNWIIRHSIKENGRYSWNEYHVLDLNFS